jgi:putative mRNA 3-end processing factor
MTAIAAAEAETVYVTHGFSPEVVRWLNENGQDAVELKTKFVGDDADDTPPEEGDLEAVS